MLDLARSTPSFPKNPSRSHLPHSVSLTDTHVKISSYLIRQPIVTGTSVLGLKYQDGVMLAADNLGEYICRLLRVRI